MAKAKAEDEELNRNDTVEGEQSTTSYEMPLEIVQMLNQQMDLMKEQKAAQTRQMTILTNVYQYWFKVGAIKHAARSIRNSNTWAVSFESPTRTNGIEELSMLNVLKQD